MADSKLSALTELLSTTEDDVVYIVEDIGGTPLSRRVRVINLVPRHTTAQMNAISSPQAGMIIYNTSTQEPFFYDGADWISMIDGLPE